jgi:acyl-CoA dehydrogenase
MLGPMTTTTNNRTNLHWSGADLQDAWVIDAAAAALAIGEHAEDHDERGDFVHDQISLLRERGFLSMLVPEELGGGGAGFADTAAALSVLARGCPSTALTLSMHTHLVAAQVWRHHRDLPAPVLPKVVNDRVVLVSTGAGDWVDSNGIAAKVDGGFRVSGSKAPSSGAPAGDILVSSARWEAADEGPQVIHFAVPFTAEGVRMVETWNTVGMRATGSHTVVLDDVFIPDAAVSLTRPAGEWHPVWNVVVGVAMPLIMAVYVGVAEEAVARALEVARRRSAVDGTAATVGRMMNHLHAAQDAAGAMVAMVDGLRFDNTNELAAAVLSRRTMVSEHVLAATRLAMEVAGGAGYSRSGGIERLFRDVHGVLYHPLPTAKQELFSGRVALGLDPVSGR